MFKSMHGITPTTMLIVLLLPFTAASAAGQTFSGEGQQATRPFQLRSGLAAFDLEHRGDGAFAVRLLDQQGNSVAELANATGIFAGSKAVRVPQDGEYVLDVTATGNWVVRLRSAGGVAAVPQTDAQRQAFEAGREQGDAAAAKVGTSGWFARGLVAGLLTGPIGTGIVVNRAGKASLTPSSVPASVQAVDRSLFTTAYEDAFSDRLKARRQRSALLGGLVGTTALVFIIIKAVDLDQIFGDDGTGPEPIPNSVVPAGVANQ